MAYRILNTIGPIFSEKGKQILERLGTTDYLNLSQDELKEKISGYDVIVAQLGLNIDKNIINKGKNLKAIATATTGLDHLDIEYAQKKGIEVISLRGENEFLSAISGTAELAFGLIIDLLRQTHAAFESVKNYQWNREAYRGHNLRGKTLGIVGLGRLGKMTARYGVAFNMKVIAYDPHIDDKLFSGCNCERVDFDSLLKNSDVISIHAHLNKDTENMVDKEAFSKMKKGAYLVNTSRGKIVNEADLLNALESGQLGGYATDVLADELNFNKNFSDSPLVEYAKRNDNLIIVPHIGGMTYESRESTDVFIAEKLFNYLKQTTNT